MTKLKLNDEVIAHIVKLIQLGLLQGLDVVDYFRQIELVSEEGESFLKLDEEYLERHELEISEMLEKIEKIPYETPEDLPVIKVKDEDE